MAAHDTSRSTEPLRQALCILLWRAPLLVPLVVVGCVVHGGVACSVLAAFALIAAQVLGMRRILLCSILCGGVVVVSQLLRQRQAQELAEALRQGGAVSMAGEVVHKLAHGVIVQTGGCGVRAVVRGNPEEWREGDMVRFVAEALPVNPPLVEGMFSTEKWMKGQGISANLAYLQGEKCGESMGWYRLVRLADDVRSSLADRLMPPGTQEDARRQVLCALVLGAKERAEADTLDIFRRGGCLHAFAVSGLHVGIIAGLLWALLRLCRVHPSVGRYVQLAVVGIYVISTGMAVPALRAYLMLAVLLLGLSLRRRPSMLNTWCFAALLVLMLQPWQLYQAGFLLSFSIYAAICLAVQYCVGAHSWLGPDAYIPPKLHTRGERLAATADLAVRGMVVVSLSAWLVSLPFSISQFHVVNTASYLTNIAISPLLPVVMFCGLLALFLGGVPVVGACCHWLAVHSSGLLVSVVGMTSSFPGAMLPAQESASPSAALVACLSYGKSFAVLGNPGVLVGDVHGERDARYTIEPALFHAGYSPAVLCGSGGAALALYRQSWPALRALADSPGGSTSFSTAAGRYTIYWPPAELPRTPAANAQPVIVWQGVSGARVIYVGNAAACTLETLPDTESRADVIILGYNPQEPVLDMEYLRSFGAGEIILLPAAAHMMLEAHQVSPARIRRLSAEYPLYTLP